MRYCDLHCATLTKIERLDDLDDRSENLQLSRKDLTAGVFLQTFAVFAENERAKMQYFFQKKELFQSVKRELTGVKCLLSVENGAFLCDGELEENVSRMADCGVKILTLVWNGGNLLGGGHETPNVGLTPLGFSAAELLGKSGIFTDVSHLSERGFFDLVQKKFSARPLIATHSNARALCPHSRNLSDAQIKAIADGGGVIGVTFYPVFLGAASPAKHIRYLIDCGGEEVAAIGSDFDGMKKAYYPNGGVAARGLYEDLKKEGLTERQIDKIFQKNVLRLFEETYPAG